MQVFSKVLFNKHIFYVHKYYCCLYFIDRLRHRKIQLEVRELGFELRHSDSREQAHKQ